MDVAQRDFLRPWHASFRWADRALGIGFVALACCGLYLDGYEALLWVWALPSLGAGLLLALSNKLAMGLSFLCFLLIVPGSYVLCDAGVRSGNLVWHHLHTWIGPILVVYTFVRVGYMLLDYLWSDPPSQQDLR